MLLVFVILTIIISISYTPFILSMRRYKIRWYTSLPPTGALMIVGGLLCIVWAGCQAEVVAVMMVLVVVGSASTLCTFQLAPMDLAPNYAGQL